MTSLPDGLDPQARRLLESFATASQSPRASASADDWITAGRAGYHQIDALAGDPEPVDRLEDGTLDGPAGPVRFRLYAASRSPAPALLLYFHGGGFVSGDLDTHDRVVRYLANRSGAVLLSVDYRLAPEHPYPAAVDDAYAALLWAGSRARDVGADPGRIILAGDSAGGLLAAVTAIRARDEGGSPVAKQILLYPDTDLRAGVNHPSWRDNDGLVLNRADKDRALSAYLPEGIDRTSPYVSPLLAPDLGRLPPAFIATGEFDPQRDEGEAYADRLRASGVTVRAVRYPGMIHGFAQMGAVLDAGRRVLDEAAAEIAAVQPA